MKCDFCSNEKVTWSYPCKSFTYIEGIIGSEGAWAACDRCHNMIEKEMHQTLAYYAIKTAGFEIPFSVMMDLHNMFRANRIGEAIAVI